MAGIQPLTDRYLGGSSNPRQHDSTYNTSYDVRGNVTNAGNPGVGGYGSFDVLGLPVGGTSGPTQSSASYSSGSNYAAPSQLTPNPNNGLSHSMSWNSHLGLTSDSGPNGASTSISYDGKGRPSSGTDANGMQVLYYYQATAPQKKTTANPGDKWVKEYYDGFGRTVKAETGSGATVVSTVETEYGPCACSPMGKVKRVSRPYAPGGSAQYWTTYSYDSLGRTVSVQQPPVTVGGISAGTTAYLYEGNTVKVTDPAGKWKKFTMNAAGELVEVREPNPADALNDFLTTYTYTEKGQLWTVTMPRPTGTQTRTFTYHASGAVATVTQPETGTTTNTVGTNVAANDYGLLKTKVDAKGQKVEYIYDTYKRVVEVKRYKVQSDTNPDACQGTKYQYDLNTWDTGFGATNLSGRLAGVEYHVCTYNGDGSLEKDRTIREMYSYSTGGRPLKKRMQLQRTDPLGGSGNGAPITGIANLDAEYTWSAEGTLLTLKYPDLRTGHPNQQLAEKGNTLTYQTDWLRRYSGMTETSPLNPGNPTTLVSGMVYGISGELTSMTYNQSGVSNVVETRQYNLLGQLTQITAMQGANTMTNLQYVFPTGTNNGRISSMVNIQSGETVTYTYDALNRLTNAVGSGWSEAYAFDGFGNLTQKGAQSIGVLAASNRLTGPGVSYDSNGNQTGMQVGTTNVANSFDIENRLLEVSGQGFRYGFGPDNRKMWTRNASNGNEDYVFWGPQGKPIGTYRASWEWTASSGSLWFNAVVSTRRWMGSKEISATSVLIHDRLSSVVGVSAGGSVTRYRYLPYGEPNTAGGSPVGSHFATYDRTDAGMYYADQRYYRDGLGRFLSADRHQARDATEPSSFNMFSYVEGDAINYADPTGNTRCGMVSVKFNGQTVSQTFVQGDECFEQLNHIASLLATPAAQFAPGVQPWEAAHWHNVWQNSGAGRTYSALIRLQTMKFSEGCQNALGQLESEFFNLTKSSPMKFINAVGAATVFNGRTANDISFDYVSDGLTGGMASVAEIMGRNGRPGALARVDAITVLGTSRIYLDPDAVSRWSDDELAANLFHEILHSIGYSDNDLFDVILTGSDRLDPARRRDTGEISRYFGQLCLGPGSR